MKAVLKKSIVGSLILFCLFLIYYFQNIIKTDIVYTHLFYLPIILSAIWWKRTAIFISVFLGLVLIISQFITIGTIALPDVFRTLMFVFVASVASYFINKNRIYELKIIKNEKLIEASKTILAKTEEINSQNIELKKLNAEKDHFMSILAHDLRSPFNALLGFLELLEENIHKYNIEKIEAQIKIINVSARDTFQLLEDLLLWIRTQSGKIPYAPKKINLSNICKDTIASLNLSAKVKQITINNFVSDEIMVFADIDMLKTILRNLLSNAIKFTNSGGQIDINAKKTESNIAISVSDNGIGIDLDIANKLFDNSQTKTTNEKGTGFGLLFCKEFVDKHGGRIWVESEMGKGSNFIFVLPLQET